MPKVGPFFYINRKLINNVCSLDSAREQADKLDNSYGHEQLYDDFYKSGDYIDYPLGRVVWDKTNKRAIIYIYKCINKPAVVGKIAEVFELIDYIVEYDLHYHCKKCSDEIWED